MSSPNDKPEKDRLIFDDLWWEMSVLEACCWGAYFATREQYCSRFESMEVALMRELGRFKKMLESMDLDADTDQGNGNALAK